MRVFILTIIVFLFGCGSGSKSEIEKLETDVSELHDEVMPLMSPLYKIRKQLQEMEANSSNVELMATINGIEVAEESMMDWMRNYDPNFIGSETETIKYLSDKKLAIEQVSIQMKESLSNGEMLLAKMKSGIIE